MGEKVKLRFQPLKETDKLVLVSAGYKGTLDLTVKITRTWDVVLSYFEQKWSLVDNLRNNLSIHFEDISGKLSSHDIVELQKFCILDCLVDHPFVRQLSRNSTECSIIGLYYSFKSRQEPEKPSSDSQRDRKEDYFSQFQNIESFRQSSVLHPTSSVANESPIVSLACEDSIKPFQLSESTAMSATLFGFDRNGIDSGINFENAFSKDISLAKGEKTLMGTAFIFDSQSFLPDGQKRIEKDVFKEDQTNNSVASDSNTNSECARLTSEATIGSPEGSGNVRLFNYIERAIQSSPSPSPSLSPSTSPFRSSSPCLLPSSPSVYREESHHLSNPPSILVPLGRKNNSTNQNGVRVDAKRKLRFAEDIIEKKSSIVDERRLGVKEHKKKSLSGQSPCISLSKPLTILESTVGKSLTSSSSSSSSSSSLPCSSPCSSPSPSPSPSPSSSENRSSVAPPAFLRSNSTIAAAIMTRRNKPHLKRITPTYLGPLTSKEIGLHSDIFQK